ncbi:MAG: DNA polymerase III subunit beta [candidate division SR1 bacterium]|nr:DNA polymerase III subunit beta [candidate division SR1 bacterium]
MKITIETAKLLEVIDLGLRFVSKNATLPILQNFYFKAAIDGLLLRATDMEKYIEIEIPCKIIMEGAITVNARMFSDIIKSIEEKEVEISVDQKSQVMTIKSAKDNFDINGIAANEYVALPEVPNENTLSVETQLFAEGISKVEYAVTEKNFSPVLTGVLLKAKEDSLIFVGTDSFRLSEFKAASGIKESDFALIVPKVTMTDIQKISEYAIANESETLTIKYSENLIAFQVQVKDMKILATSLLIQGNFPEYDREEIMPRTFNTKILVDKNLCEKAIRKIGILTRDINNYIQIETNKDSIIISSGKTDKGAGTTNIPAIIEGPSLSFGINGKYITDFIKIIKGDELTFNVIDNQKPLILMDKDDASYRYVVRPLINS